MASRPLCVLPSSAVLSWLSGRTGFLKLLPSALSWPRKRSPLWRNSRVGTRSVTAVRMSPPPGPLRGQSGSLCVRITSVSTQKTRSHSDSSSPTEFSLAVPHLSLTVTPVRSVPLQATGLPFLPPLSVAQMPSPPAQTSVPHAGALSVPAGPSLLRNSVLAQPAGATSPRGRLPLPAWALTTCSRPPGRSQMLAWFPARSHDVGLSCSGEAGLGMVKAER